jgi:hypothetical protein
VAEESEPVSEVETPPAEEVAQPEAELAAEPETEVVEEVVEELAAEEEPAPAAEAAERPSDGDGAALYEGAVELTIPPPVGLDRMLQLHKNLRHISQVEVMNLGVSKDKGITIRLYLDSPVPLLQLLAELPEVETASEAEAPTGEGEDGQADDKAGVKRIVVTTHK